MRTLAVLALAGVLAGAWQLYYIHLPLEEAATIDACRLGAYLDCYDTLAAFGRKRTILGAPLIATLACLQLFCLLAALLAWWDERRRQGLLGWARVGFVLSAILAMTLAIGDWADVGKTAPSTAALVVVSLAGTATAIRSGLSPRSILEAAPAAVVPAVLAFAAGTLAQGTGEAAVQVARLERERAAAPPAIRWPEFADRIPRYDAARLEEGLETTREVLLFVDPAAEASRRVLADALELCPQYCSRVRMLVYARGEAGATLIAAQREGRVQETLRAMAEGEAAPVQPTEEDRSIAAYVESRLDEHAPKTWPAAMWNGGVAEGGVDLRQILSEVLRT